MLYSMTGYGRAVCEYNGKNIVIELRSLNSKSLDLKLKLPAAYRAQEIELRRIASTEIERGKVDVNIDIQYIDGTSSIVNAALFESYSKELSTLCEKNNIAKNDILRSVLMMPNIYLSDSDALTDEEWAVVSGGLNAALTHFNTFRKDEGAMLEQDFRNRITLIKTYLDDVPLYENERILRLRERFEKNMQDWAEGKLKHYDENRLEQELLFYIEKLDVTEEKTRLRQHCDYFLQELDDKKTIAKGRKLNFISQEIGREVNTIGSKANHAELQRLVVMMKDELEKVKEQINNVL